MAFLVVTGETTPIGLIGEIAVGLHTTEDRVGLAIGGYALIAGLSSVPLAHWTAHLDRRSVLLASLVVFAAGHLAAATARDVAVFTAARATGALGHGLLFAVAVPTAIRLADPGVQGQAGARVMVGSATALVAGTPLATYLGQAAGWRYHACRDRRRGAAAGWYSDTATPRGAGVRTPTCRAQPVHSGTPP